MVRRPSGATWRASLGFAVTALAAVLLFVALWQVFRLGGAAGASVSVLTREKVAAQFQQMLLPTYVDVNRYRLAMMLAQPSGAPEVRARLTQEMRRAEQFAQAHPDDLALSRDWTSVERAWATAQRVHRGDRDAGKALSDFIHVFYMVYMSDLEDLSGIEYDSNRVTQDLGDIAFARMPGAVNETLRSDLIAENAQQSGTLSIPDRVTLAGLARQLTEGGDLDFAQDDWTMVLQKLGQSGVETPAALSRFAREDNAMVAAGQRFYDYVNREVVLRERPAGDPRVVRSLGEASLTATLAMATDVTSALATDLGDRVRYESSRNRYVYLSVLLALVLVIGVMLLVAEITARRDRQALIEAQQESDRLSAELARQNAERALRLSEAQFRAVFDGAAMGIAILDRNGVILDANAVFRNIYGENSAGVLEGHDAEFAELMRGERDLFEFEQHVMTPDGHEAWTDSTISLVNDDAGKPYFAICMFRDLTELKRSERRMLHDMTHDTLSGLPNRALFETKVREQFLQMKASPESSFAVLFVDLDRFKDINESLGHGSGDFVISQVSNRLRAAIEPADVVARLGSDEFAVLLRSLPDVLHVEVIARRVLGALSKPVMVGGRSIYVSASVGIALGTSSYARGEDVMRDADIAMRHAKGGGGSRFAVFDSRMHARAEKRLQLTTDLRLALENGEFDLLYQPIVKIADGELAGCEALLRWNHPVEGVIGPGDFMPLAEQTGLAVPIGRFVVRTACAQIGRWKRMTGRQSLFPINVNVSAAELLDAEFESVLLSAVRESGASPSDLVLEITESVVLDSGTRPNALVERLRSHGFGICIDDFGTGYSSLRYLQQFKVDAIKIDRSFVSGQDGDVASEPIVRTLMTLAEAFDVRVVAEGIETQRQRDVLRNAGCRLGQGYYYARAISAVELAAMYPSVFGLTPRHASA